MKVWTAQYRYTGPDRYDVTVKTGRPAFAPSWGMVMGYKRGELSEKAYTSLYKDLMRRSYRANRQAWMNLIEKDEVTLVCFCKAGTFCHRLLLVDLLEKVCRRHGVPFMAMGERPLP